ncbi:general secretion pathway protein GspE [Corallococcus sp. H22C18031201]|nr:general secretion pathway protein GspE [Corallococcus sp. H22C18031201]
MRKKIGELLVQAGVVTEEQVKTALASVRRGQGRKLGEVLISQGACNTTDIARALATQYELPFVELPENIPVAVSSLVSVDFQTEHRILPFRLESEGRGEKLHVAVEDPADLTIVDELRFQLSKQLRIFVASPDDMDTALARARGEPLDIVEAEPLDEEPVAAPPRPRPAASAAAMPWELPPPPPAESNASGIDVLEDLLGAKARPGSVKPPPPPVPDDEPEPGSGKPRVPVVMFGGAAQGSRPSVVLTPTPSFSEEDLAVLDDLDRLSKGEEPSLDTEKVKPARMVASLIRLLIRKGLIQELEFLEELARK